MRNIISMILFLSIFPVFGLIAQKTLKLADKNASPETIRLYSNLNTLAEKGIMFGHQDDLAYGIGWKAPNGQSDVYKITGDYPAVFGWDLGHIETGSACNLDSVPFSDIRKYALQVYARGGINEFSWHFNNPLTGGSAWDISNPGTVKSILPDGSLNSLYNQWLDKVASFLSDLKDENGKAILVLFRPFHEQGGNWFWWGKQQCTSSEFAQLWQYTVKYLCQTKKLHNLIFVFSNSDSFRNQKEYLERYPGDPYVDIIGFDIYQSAEKTNGSFAEELKQKLLVLIKISKEKNKLPALTEIGYEQIPYAAWWTEVLWPALQDFRLSYALFWRNAADRPNHYFMPYPGQMSEKDFLKLYNLPGTLFGKDLEKERIYK